MSGTDRATDRTADRAADRADSMTDREPATDLQDLDDVFDPTVAQPAVRAADEAHVASGIRRRLSRLMLLGAAVTALLSMLAVLAVGWAFHDHRARASAEEVARLTASSLEAPLAFMDDKAASDTLLLLQVRGTVRGAWLYDRERRLAARYDRGDAPALPPERSSFDRLLVHHPVSAGPDRLGTLVLEFDEGPAYRQLALEGLAVVLATALSMALSMVATRRLAGRIADPIRELARTSTDIAESRRYDRRLAHAAGDDEVSVAVRAFNAMLDEVEDRDDALEAANHSLEQRVQRRTADLEQARARAEAASVAKTRFLATMSHELRTPLNAVLGAAQLLAQSASEAERKELTETIGRSGSSLLGLIENVLDISRIESGALQLANEEFNLVDCIESAIATASVHARANEVTLAVIVDPALPAWRRGDSQRLRQVVLNLVGNAVKFAQRGDVVLRVAAGESPESVRVSVEDTGIGMDLAASRDIFHPFTQADDSTTRRFGGTGLGLTISRELVRAMGGDIHVDSAPGDGARFWFEIELPMADLGHEPAPLHTGRVVYFEPHDASAMALDSLLLRMGFEPRRVLDAEELRAALAGMSIHGNAEASDATDADDPQPPWLLVAAEDERAWPLIESAAAVLSPDRVIAMNQSESHAIEAARDRFKLARSVSKPVLRSALVSRIGARRALPRDATVSPGGPARRHEQADARILVVEDDPTNQMIVCSMLRNAGYGTTVAVDGQSAIETLTTQDFDVVLMDWQMPGIDGLEVTRRLRAGDAGPVAQAVPVIGLTANAFSEDRQACLAAGMDDFLTKPVLATQLVAAVERALDLRRG